MPITPFLGFTPDLDLTTPGMLKECASLIPSPKGMKAAPSNASTAYAALSEAITGAFLVMKLDGSVRFFACSASAINEGSGGSWTDRSRGGGYAAAAARWRGAQFGNDTLAANKTAALQRSTGAAFANLTAPKCAHVITLRNFAMVADFDDTGMGGFTNLGDTPDGWWCSAFEDVTSWTPSVASQSARGRLVAVPGPITALKRQGDNAVAYKEQGILVGAYVGASGGVFAWNPVKSPIGCASSEAVVSIGPVHFFPGENDFYAFDGNEPVEIGQHIRSWFFEQLNPSFADKIAALHDRANGHIWWFYPNSASVLGELNGAVVYDYRSRRWGVADRDIEMPVEIVLDGINYDTLGSTTGFTGDYDSASPIAYDSPFFSAGKPVPAVFGTDHKPYTLSGVPGDWSFKTGLVGDDVNVVFMNRLRIRWVEKPAAAAMTNLYTMDAGTAPAQDSTRSMNATRGHFDMRRAANWHQFQIAANGVGEMVGLDQDGNDGGTR